MQKPLPTQIIAPMNTWPGKGTILYRKDKGFVQAVMRTLFNQRDRALPEAMVQANDVNDVIEAIHLARRENLKIGICSGGHSWSANHVREGGLLLDMSRFKEMRIDRDRAIAQAGPGCGGSDFVKALGKEGLFFPAGHCKGVSLGGYLLQGGFGWHSRKLGMACESVMGLDIVTADGKLVHASEKENADLYWAARGSGGGFFGVATRFHLRVYPKPRVVGCMIQVYAMEHLEDVMRWAHETSSAVPDSVEFQMTFSQRAFITARPGIEVFGVVIAQSLKEAREAVAFMRACPVKKKASIKTPFVPTGLALLYRGVMSQYPQNHRWNVDNMWTHASAEQLLPGLHKIIRTMPPPPSNVFWLNWAPRQMRPDMAFSKEDQFYLALYGGWKRPEDDLKYGNWATDRMREMEHLSSGIQLADENLGSRTAPFASDAHLEKLDALRASWDPNSRFHSWQSRP